MEEYCSGIVTAFILVFIERVPLHMFVRFRTTKRRLQASLVETTRINGCVRHEHIASFGSVGIPATAEQRMTFWLRLLERMDRLSNRVDDVMRNKIFDDINARIPMVFLEERNSLKLANAEKDEHFWTKLHNIHRAEGNATKKLLTDTLAANAERTAQIAAMVTATKDRIKRLRNGDET
jgi:hypothetical protein